MDLLHKIIQSIYEFPTLPTVYTALIEVMANPMSTPQDAANVIMHDQAASLKILKAANSSLFGFRGKIDTVSKAIFHLGFEEVRNLIVTIQIMDIFKSVSYIKYFNPIELWKHSLGVGVITKRLGTRLGVKNLEIYYLSGIIHDIGKLLFISKLENDYIRTINYANDNSLTLRDAEADILGITHNIAGELIAERWGLPEPILNSIKFYYSGEVDGNFDVLTSCVHVADIAANMFFMGDICEELVPEPNINIWKPLNLTDNTFTLMMPKIITDYSESLRLFNLD